jgi:hypothetical protein
VITRELDEIMSFGHLIRVNEDGTITEDVWYVHTPESVHVDTDADGSILGIHTQNLIDEQQREGWSFFTKGYSSQDRYTGPVMHECEAIGNRLERDILAQPGYYVAVSVEVYDDPEHPAGWAVLYRESLPS